MILRCMGAFVVLAGLTTSAFAGSASRAQPTLRDQEQAACAGDAQKLCGEFIPNEDKIAACMKAKFSDVSAGCKKFFK